MFKKIINKLHRQIENITVKEMLEIIKTNEKAILLDVRSVQEYREGHVAKSINIPIYALQKEARQKVKG